MNLYCLSGLGADQRIFRKLEIPGITLVSVPWLVPDKHDDMACYAQKLASKIPEKNPLILGVSFGGMLATEISRMQPVKKVFIVSSLKDASQLPPVSPLLKFLFDHRMFPVGLSKIRNKVTFERFGAETEEEKNLLMDILRDTDNGFSKWAFKALLNWNTTTPAVNTLHLHGSADQIIPPDHLHPDYLIEGGTHFMIYKRASEVAAIIGKELDSL